jgi:hypothetical protein
MSKASKAKGSQESKGAREPQVISISFGPGFDHICWGEEEVRWAFQDAVAEQVAEAFGLNISKVSSGFGTDWRVMEPGLGKVAPQVDAKVREIVEKIKADQGL